MLFPTKNSFEACKLDQCNMLYNTRLKILINSNTSPEFIERMIKRFLEASNMTELEDAFLTLTYKLILMR